MTKFVLIALGGAAGSVLRYAAAGVVQRASGAVFPIGTLVVNVAGCFAIGMLWALFSGPLLVREEWRAAILVGVLGGFTTFSTYAWETFSLACDGQRSGAMLNFALNNVLGLAAVWIAYRVGQWWFGV